MTLFSESVRPAARPPLGGRVCFHFARVASRPGTSASPQRRAANQVAS
jgi:hypothetical protein